MIFFKNIFKTHKQTSCKTSTNIIVLKLGPERRVDPGLELGRVKEKIKGEKTRRDPVKTRSQTR